MVLSLPVVANEHVAAGVVDAPPRRSRELGQVNVVVRIPLPDHGGVVRAVDPVVLRDEAYETALKSAKRQLPLEVAVPGWHVNLVRLPYLPSTIMLVSVSEGGWRTE